MSRTEGITGTEASLPLALLAWVLAALASVAGLAAGRWSSVLGNRSRGSRSRCRPCGPCLAR